MKHHRLRTQARNMTRSDKSWTLEGWGLLIMILSLLGFVGMILLSN